MNQQLLYEIAEHRIKIDTPDAVVTEKLITSFRPFRVNRDEEHDVLFHFFGSKQVAIPERAPDDTMEADGMSFEVYHKNGSITVSVTNSDKKHSFSISADKKNSNY